MRNITIELTKELYESPIRERNIDKYGEVSNQCICCGRIMNKQEIDNALWIHMNEDWMAVNPDIITDDNIHHLTGAGSQGCFPIGNECAKKMQGFTFRNI